MILYGTKATNILNGKIINTSCNNCSEVSSMTYSVYGKYAHVYWIPFFPFKKLTFVECDNCKRTFEQKDFSEEIVSKLGKEKEKIGKLNFPIWMFSGSAIIAIIIGFAIYQSKIDDENEAKYIENPKKGDLYHIRLANSYYTAAMVTKATKDSVFVTFSDYETDQVTGVDKVSELKNFTSAKFGYSTKEVKELFKKDTIYQIDRN